MTDIDKHIVLIGFMGSGKSTVGRILADKLGSGFVDMDEEIEQSQGQTISQIFSTLGESQFRKIETATIKRLLSTKKPLVISTGGGTPCFGENMSLIKENSYSFYLKVGRASLAERLQRSTDRPLINGMNKKDLKIFIKDKLSEREHYYKQAYKTVRGIYHPESVSLGIIEHIESSK